MTAQTGSFHFAAGDTVFVSHLPPKAEASAQTRSPSELAQGAETPPYPSGETEMSGPLPRRPCSPRKAEASEGGWRREHPPRPRGIRVSGEGPAPTLHPLGGGIRAAGHALPPRPARLGHRPHTHSAATCGRREALTTWHRPAGLRRS